MNSSTKIEFRCFLADRMEQFMAYKRALGRRYDVERKTIRLLDRYVVDQGI